MGLIISTRQSEDQYIARVLKDTKLNATVQRVNQETLGNLMKVTVELLIGLNFNLDLVYEVNLDTGKIKLVENTGWAEEAEDTIHNLTPNNWEKEFKKAIWIGKLYNHSEILTYWNAYASDSGDMDTLNEIRRFFQTDYRRIPEIILNAIKSNN